MSERSEEKQNILKIMFGRGGGRRHEGEGAGMKGGTLNEYEGVGLLIVSLQFCKYTVYIM